MVLAPFGLISYLALEGGGFDAILYGRLGVVAWLAVLACVALGGGLFRLPRGARVAVFALAGFAAWVGLSMIWSESADRSAQELARAATYLGVLVLFAVVQTREHRHLTLGSAAAGIAFVGILALLSRMEPEAFPKNETLDLVRASQERLNYPLNYWNGLAGLIAIGVPLVAHFAACGRALTSRVLASAALPALLLAVYLTLSRGGGLALAAGVVALIALHPRRGAVGAQLAVAGVAGAVLVWAAEARSGFVNGIRIGEGLTQGDEMLAITLVVCALAGLWPLAARRLRPRRLPSMRSVSPRTRSALALGAIAVLAALALLTGAPGEIEDGWQQFKDAGVTRGTERLESASGNGRYQWWDAALDANSSSPLLGIGAGTFQFWWAREGTIAGRVIDAHSLYVESLGELGIVGLLLILGAVGGPLLLLARGALRDARTGSALLAAATAAGVSFAIAAATDWAWELPVLPVAFAIVVAAGLGGAAAPTARANARGRPALAAIAAAGILAIAPALLGEGAVRSSQEQVRAGDLGAALGDAERAGELEPYSGAAALQEALVLELQGNLDAAARSAAEATRKEETNWANWLVLSRIEIERGRAGAGLRAFRTACGLNPGSGFCVDAPEE